MIAIRLLLACLVLAVAAPASAQEEGIATIRLKHSKCTRAKAKPVTVEALVASPDAFDRACVRVIGVTAGPMLYTDQTGYERAMVERNVDRVGLYGDPGLLRALPEKPTPTEIVGQVSTCAGRPFVAGYCHYVVDGVFLIATEARRPKP